MTAFDGVIGNVLVVVLTGSVFCGSSGTAAFSSESGLSEDDVAAAFRTAGFSRQENEWRACEDPRTLSYSPGVIEEVRDLNGDGFPEAVISEAGTYCFGHTGTGFWIVSQTADGNWRLVASSVGMPSFLPERSAGGWPDIEIGGPGFCFPVIRWDGEQYAVDRYQYAGEPCRPD